jgi:hypothetical protein
LTATRTRTAPWLQQEQEQRLDCNKNKNSALTATAAVSLTSMCVCMRTCTTVHPSHNCLIKGKPLLIRTNWCAYTHTPQSHAATAHSLGPSIKFMFHSEQAFTPLHTRIYIYIYVYIYTHTNICIYIYSFSHSPRPCENRLPWQPQL